MRRLLATILACALLSVACTPEWQIIPVPPAPVPPAPPQPPVPPTPPPVADRVPYERVVRIVAGLSTPDLLALMVRPPTLGPVRQDDGTSLYRWPVVNRLGEPRNADVQVDERGTVLGYGLWRVP